MCNLRDRHRFQRLLWEREAVVFLVEESGVHSPEDAQRMVPAGRDECPAGGVDSLLEGTGLMAGLEGPKRLFERTRWRAWLHIFTGRREAFRDAGKEGPSTPGWLGYN
jgi:hypothetical protein